MTITWPSFEELKELPPFKIIEIVLKNINDQYEENKKNGKHDELLENLYFSSRKLRESPYNIPEFGNFTAFDLSYSNREDNEIIIQGSDYIFWGEEGMKLLKKLEGYFFQYNCSLPGLFFFLNLLHLNNESKFEYAGTIILFFKLLTEHKLKTEQNLFNQHTSYVLNLFESLLEKPTFRMKLFFQYFQSDSFLFKYIGMAYVIVAPELLKDQEDLWSKVLEYGSPLIESIKPWKLTETIDANNKILLALLASLAPNNKFIQFLDGGTIVTMLIDKFGKKKFISFGEKLFENPNNELATGFIFRKQFLKDQLNKTG